MSDDSSASRAAGAPAGRGEGRDGRSPLPPSADIERAMKRLSKALNAELDKDLSAIAPREARKGDRPSAPMGRARAGQPRSGEQAVSDPPQPREAK